MTTSPKFGDIIRVPAAGGLASLPDSNSPYFAMAEHGTLFLHRKLPTGRGVVRHTGAPKGLGKLNFGGEFTFTADPIPGVIISQIASFFRRIFETRHAEAIVLLTMNNETGEWGTFVPTQLVSHGGIGYVYNPAHIRPGHGLVGSIHSHCDFNPFHSGTDTGDAEGFDGIHCTIGYIDKDEPGIVAMASLNGVNMHYDKATFPKLFDYTQLWQHDAPAWWDRYVGSESDKPVGYELFAQFNKPTIIKTQKTTAVTRWTPPPKPQYNQNQKSFNGSSNIGDAQRAFDTFMGAGALTDDELEIWRDLGITTGHRPWWADRSSEELANSGYVWDLDKQTYVWGGRQIQRPNTLPTVLNESAAFNRRKAAERGVDWDNEGRLVYDRGWDDTEWRDILEKEIGIETIQALDNADIIRDEDIEWADDNPKEGSTREYWVDTVMSAISEGVNLLQMLGVKVTVGIEAAPPEDAELLPDDTITKQEFHHGVH